MRISTRDNLSRLAAIAAIALMLGGCAVGSATPVQVVADSYCLAAKKRTWSVNDTQETIDEAIRINAGIDKACPRKA
jgi:PBP1b-binding outer membrane lipoprotein LpoB